MNATITANITELISEVSQFVLKAYNEQSYQTSVKADRSFLTSADLASNELLKNGLKKITPHIPVFSEEDPMPKLLPNDFWIIDPIDGTRDFVERTGDFAINVARITNFEGASGWIAAPTEDAVFYSHASEGVAYKNNKRLTRKTPISQEFSAVTSNFHSSSETLRFLSEAKISKIIKKGSSLKLCMLAEGNTHAYPRLTPTNRWDIVAGQIIAESTGCLFKEIGSDRRLGFPKDKNELPPFVGFCPELQTPELTNLIKNFAIIK